ncbi:MAG: hypothetical protein COW32_03405 [Candidatus Aquicultor secundus]|uniref:PIN domain-containing protein n=1 Tax=Candidatus Aquicultor secundus TaxID=1973895 RepID=A0A2M7T885_9ACTN|nr:hypothetical protein [Candidatus Aquicultor secundus]OIO83226.1 MAG: hypothetical protein AUK32_10420 [Candidatus Aquicultor secundus]PIU27841.1 MAG: hypothetical protein COT10_01390 [Candidatus Aquicultor secundus]PIW22661.1 MAG: hypothetical protein COW32_03405 [Candidatus Aquicultor secundus]PIX51957.1 MAG: hypothetical protein COZ51_06815 [Candidatus Aquicultor secundus]PIZ39320.1 MAG: hypothetical protein COY37_05065 [Candidatus Aquicultor secundus]
MKRVFVDTNIPMYWGGAESAYKEPCGYILGAIAREELYGETSAEVFLKNIPLAQGIFYIWQ